MNLFYSLWLMMVTCSCIFGNVALLYIIGESNSFSAMVGTVSLILMVSWLVLVFQESKEDEI